MDDSTLHTLTISSVYTHDDESPVSVHSVPLHIPLSPISKVADDSDTDGESVRYRQMESTLMERPEFSVLTAVSGLSSSPTLSKEGEEALLTDQDVMEIKYIYTVIYIYIYIYIIIYNIYRYNIHLFMYGVYRAKASP